MRARLLSRRKENTVKQRSIKNGVKTRWTHVSPASWYGHHPTHALNHIITAGIRQPWKAVSAFILNLISKIDCTHVDQTKQCIRLLCTHPSVENLLCGSVLLTHISFQVPPFAYILDRNLLQFQQSQRTLSTGLGIYGISSDTYSTVPEYTSPHVNSVLPELAGIFQKFYRDIFMILR